MHIFVPHIGYISPLIMFLLLLWAHAIADYPLQGDFLAKAKNISAPIPGVPWWQALTAHAIIQAGFVGLITGNVALAFAEFVAHWLIDLMKCRGEIGFNMDQLMHVACKVTWVLVMVSMH